MAAGLKRSENKELAALFEERLNEKQLTKVKIWRDILLAGNTSQQLFRSYSVIVRVSVVHECFRQHHRGLTDQSLPTNRFTSNTSIDKQCSAEVIKMSSPTKVILELPSPTPSHLPLRPPLLDHQFFKIPKVFKSNHYI